MCHCVDRCLTEAGRGRAEADGTELKAPLRSVQLPQEVMSCSVSCFSGWPVESSASRWCCGSPHLLLLAKLDDAAAHHTGYTGSTGSTGVSGLSHVVSLFPWWQDVGTSSWPEGGATE